MMPYIALVAAVLSLAFSIWCASERVRYWLHDQVAQGDPRPDDLSWLDIEDRKRREK